MRVINLDLLKLILIFGVYLYLVLSVALETFLTNYIFSFSLDLGEPKVLNLAEKVRRFELKPNVYS